MSGGSFDYAYVHVETFADLLTMKLDGNEQDAEYGPAAGFGHETVSALRGIEAQARALAQVMRDVEWLYSGDISEATFHDIHLGRAQVSREAGAHRERT